MFDDIKHLRIAAVFQQFGNNQTRLYRVALQEMPYPCPSARRRAIFTHRRMWLRLKVFM
ncbi:MAG: hypothetical protein GPOALKHO_000087 [Sodalis sp.]|nr:MAG: hypothetical protein GPOALKHO_000087 [Sodalis sp.]